MARLRASPPGELANLLKQYNAAKGLKLTKATQAAIDAYEKFITDHPADPLIDSAANGVLNLIQLYEQNTAYDVASAAYTDFATFAAKTKVLAQSVPGGVSFTERAIYSSAGAAGDQGPGARRRSPPRRRRTPTARRSPRRRKSARNSTPR